MPRTEAGKRLLENGDAYTYTRAVLADQIDAIEAEARNDWAGASLEQGRREGVAAERARIAKAVRDRMMDVRGVAYRELAAVLAIAELTDE